MCLIQRAAKRRQSVAPGVSPGIMPPVFQARGAGDRNINYCSHLESLTRSRPLPVLYRRATLRPSWPGAVITSKVRFNQSSYQTRARHCGPTIVRSRKLYFRSWGTRLVESSNISSATATISLASSGVNCCIALFTRTTSESVRVMETAHNQPRSSDARLVASSFTMTFEGKLD